MNKKFSLHHITALFLAVCLSLMLTACRAPADETSSAPEPAPSTDASLQDSPVEEPEPVIVPEDEVHYVKTALTVLKVSADQESAEPFDFTLNLPEYTTVSYQWGEHETSAPVILGDDDWYMQTSSISTGFSEEHLTLVIEESGGTVEALTLGGMNMLLAIVPEEKYSAVEGEKKLADGYLYTYYILLEEEAVLPLTFFAETHNGDAKREFEPIVSSFAVL